MIAVSSWAEKESAGVTKWDGRLSWLVHDQRLEGPRGGVLLKRDNKDRGPTQMEVGDRLSYWNYGGLIELSCRPLGPVEDAGCHYVTQLVPPSECMGYGLWVRSGCIPFEV